VSVDISEPTRLGELHVASGRVIGWAEWGHPDGIPVLLCPGAATTRSLGFGAGALEALGVRLISLDRPGLGASTPQPGKSFRDFAADVDEFAALRGLGRPAMVIDSSPASDLTTISVPVDLWYGEQDTSHSPDLGSSLADRIPEARRHIVPGIGGAVLWTRAETILRTLLGHTDPLR